MAKYFLVHGSNLQSGTSLQFCVHHYEIFIFQMTMALLHFMQMFSFPITAKTFTGFYCIYEQHDGCLISIKNCLPFVSAWAYPGVMVAHLFLLIVLCFMFCFGYPRPVSCVSNVASFSGQYILDLPLWCSVMLFHKRKQVAPFPYLYKRILKILKG